MHQLVGNNFNKEVQFRGHNTSILSTITVRRAAVRNCVTIHVHITPVLVRSDGLALFVET